MNDTPLPSALTHPLRTASLPTRKATRFDLKPDDATRAALAEELGITAIHALRFKGTLTPEGRQDFRLEAQLDAEVEQPCTITLAPVRTVLRETLLRRYLADVPEPEGEEVEIPADDFEALPEVIDLGTVATEALALALPLYPRAEGAALEQAVFAEAGVEPLTDEALRPFAGLAGLAARLKGDGGDDPGGNRG